MATSAAVWRGASQPSGEPHKLKKAPLIVYKVFTVKVNHNFDWVHFACCAGKVVVGLRLTLPTPWIATVVGDGRVGRVGEWRLSWALRGNPLLGGTAVGTQ